MFGNVIGAGSMESENGNVKFVCAYLEYLLVSGEDVNAQALFECTVGTSITPNPSTTAANTNNSTTSSANVSRLRHVWDIYNGSTEIWPLSML